MERQSAEIEAILKEALAVEDGFLASKKEVYTNLANAVYEEGAEKHEVSKKARAILLDFLWEKRYKARGLPRADVPLPTSYWNEVMTGLGYTDPRYDPAGEVPVNGTSNSSGIGVMSGTEYEIMLASRDLAINNYRNINRFLSKLEVPAAAIAAADAAKTDAEKKDRLHAAEELVLKRRQILRDYFKKNHENPGKPAPPPESVLKEIKRAVHRQELTAAMFDDRASLTTWQKILAHVAVAIGYNRNQIARMLRVTSKHLKLNIYTDASEQEMLAQLQWFDRCPNPDCGWKLSEYFEAKVKQKGKPAEHFCSEDYELEYLKPTGYQAENLKLVQQVRSLRRRK